MPGAEGEERARRLLDGVQQVQSGYETWCRLHVAVGVVMERRQVDASDALALLVAAAERDARALPDLVEEVILARDVEG